MELRYNGLMSEHSPSPPAAQSEAVLDEVATGASVPVLNGPPVLPAVAGEARMVPWVGDTIVFLRRCSEADLAPVGGWLDVHLAGDYFFKRGHLRNILRDPNCETWAVEADGVMIGFVMMYHGSRLHNLYLAAEWQRQGLGASIVGLLRPQTIRAKTNMLAADPTPFYQRLGYEVVGADPKRPWILEMARKAEEATMDVRTEAAPATAAAVPAGQATSPPIAAPKVKAPPSIGKLPADQVVAIAAKLRALSDDELAAVGHAAAVNSHWKARQQAARQRRLEREQAEAAAAAGQHLAPGLTGEARAKVARARAEAAVGALFAPPALNGPPQ
jgi:GNAT superfamily N-acetyltransferase